MKLAPTLALSLFSGAETGTVFCFVFFIPPIFLLCQKWVPTFPTMQPACRKTWTTSISYLCEEIDNLYIICKYKTLPTNTKNKRTEFLEIIKRICKYTNKFHNKKCNKWKAFVNIFRTFTTFKETFVNLFSFCELKKRLWISILHLWICFLHTEYWENLSTSLKENQLVSFGHFQKERDHLLTTPIPLFKVRACSPLWAVFFPPNYQHQVTCDDCVHIYMQSVHTNNTETNLPLYTSYILNDYITANQWKL